MRNLDVILSTSNSIYAYTGPGLILRARIGLGSEPDSRGIGSGRLIESLCVKERVGSNEADFYHHTLSIKEANDFRRPSLIKERGDYV